MDHIFPEDTVPPHEDPQFEDLPSRVVSCNIMIGDICAQKRFATTFMGHNMQIFNDNFCIENSIMNWLFDQKNAQLNVIHRAQVSLQASFDHMKSHLQAVEGKMMQQQGLQTEHKEMQVHIAEVEGALVQTQEELQKLQDSEVNWHEQMQVQMEMLEGSLAESQDMLKRTVSCEVTLWQEVRDLCA